jgi:hypothetical protein
LSGAQGSGRSGGEHGAAEGRPGQKAERSPEARHREVGFYDREG